MAASQAPVGTSVLAHRGDSVAYLVPSQVGSCGLGQVVTGRVVASGGSVVRVGAKQITLGGERFSQLLVNGEFAGAIPHLGAQSFSPVRVDPHQFFILGTGGSRACDSRAFGTVAASSLVGYTQTGMAQRVGAVQRRLDDRITAEKYVAGVYLLFVAFFFGYLLIHAGKLSRLQRDVAALGALAEEPLLANDAGERRTT
jgi:type IV secretory pathway protease TraF